VALIKKRLGIDAVLTPGKTGQFEVIADGERVWSEVGTGSHGSLARAIPIPRAWWSNLGSGVRVARVDDHDVKRKTKEAAGPSKLPANDADFGMTR
jgi:hypothetical protein